MGWCSGTEIFDVVARHVLDKKNAVPEKEKLALLVALIEVLCDQDWDRETESAYIHDPLIRAAFIQYNYNWEQHFKDMDEDNR